MNYSKAYHSVRRLHSYNGQDISVLARWIYIDMVSLAKNGLDVFPSNDYLAKEFGVNTRTIIRAVQELQKAGLIEGKRRKDTSKIYTILVMPEDLEQAPAPKVTYENKTSNLTVNEEPKVKEEEASQTTAQEFLATVTEEPASLVPSLEELLASAPVVDVAKVKAEVAARSKAKEEEAAIIAKEKAQYEAGTLKATRSLFNK